MADVPYSNREIDQRFNTLEHRLFDEEEGFLPRIERQTIKTNGRVNKHDRIMLIFGTALVVLLIERYPEIGLLLAHLGL